MKIFAVHDTDGNISALLTVPPNSPPGEINIGPSQFRTELKLAGMSIDLNDPQIHDRLNELIETHKVECGAAKATLVKKR